MADSCTVWKSGRVSACKSCSPTSSSSTLAKRPRGNELTMIKSSPWIKLLPPLAFASTALMVAAAVLLLTQDGGGLPLLLVGAALLLLLTMMLAYQRAGDLRRMAEAHAAQNERNQQAILTLLDELSNLADGDLTVQATVTEDITGAIADSINYAIEALRELVATINDTSILVDAAAKQSEATVRHLVRSSETQAKQTAAASEAVTRMAQSIEEVSGNAERCSDVARHAVDVAHKGGE